MCVHATVYAYVYVYNVHVLWTWHVSMHAYTRWVANGKLTCGYSVWPNIDTWLYVYSYDQALASAQLGQQKMQQLGVAVKRPDDYFAEMIKTDDHMRKVWHITSYHGGVVNVIIGERKSS